MAKAHKSYIGLVGAVMMTIGSWAAGTGPWAELISRAMLPALFLQVGSVLVAWISPNPDWSKGILSKKNGTTKEGE